MNETRCKYDRETGVYLTPDGATCETPRREHCHHRRTCSNHLAWGELTCGTCLGRTRRTIARIGDLAPLTLTAALEAGRIEATIVSLAGPQADPSVTLSHRIREALLRDVVLSQVDGPDDNDPTDVLGTWQRMIAEDYGHPLPDRITLATAVAYLDRNLHRIANDEHQDFRQLTAEARRCLDRLEAELRVRPFVQQGVRCPICQPSTDEDGKPRRPPRLRRVYPHWCEDPECCREHHSLTLDRETGEMVPDTRGDIWQCPKDRDHWWTHEDYENRLEDREAPDATPSACA